MRPTGLRGGVSVSSGSARRRLGRSQCLAAASGGWRGPRLVLAAAAVPWSSSSALAASRDAPETLCKRSS